MGTGDQGSESTTGRGPDVEPGPKFTEPGTPVDRSGPNYTGGKQTGAGKSQGTENPPFKFDADGNLLVFDYITGKYVRG